jgi:hypothetical protein
MFAIKASRKGRRPQFAPKDFDQTSMFLRRHKIHTRKIDLLAATRADEVNLSSARRPAVEDRVSWLNASHLSLEGVAAMWAGYVARL